MEKLKAFPPGVKFGSGTVITGPTSFRRFHSAHADALLIGRFAAPDPAGYRALAVRSMGHPVTYYSAVAPGLFDTIIAKYSGGQAHTHQQAAQ